MRMRKKKNLDIRFAACADVMAFEPKEKRGKWRALFGNDHPLHVEIGCGKGRFAIGMAEQHPDINASIAAIREGNLREVARTMGNVLELVTAREYPVIEEIKDVMRRSGALGAMMSGSGPTVFGLFEDKGTAEEALRRLKRAGLARQVYLTYIFHGGRRNE